MIRFPFGNTPRSAGAPREALLTDIEQRDPIRRDRRGRFAKGASGNSAGRPPGIMNQATRIAALLLTGEAGALTRKAIELALAGDIAALRLCLDRLIAPQREQPVAFAMPPIEDAADLAGAMAALAGAAATGAIRPAELAALSQLVEAQGRVIEINQRVAAQLAAARQPGVDYRFDLRAGVVIAHSAGAVRDEVGELDPAVVRLCEPVVRLGQSAADALAAIPDTPALLAADGAFLAAHPLPLDRELHPLCAEIYRLGGKL